MALESSAGLVISPGMGFRVTSMVSLTAGTMFLMWLGEQITERGLGNGISIIIFAGIAAGLPNSIGGLLELVRTGSMSIIVALLIVVLVAMITYFVVFVERGQRKILVNYARRQVGNKVYGGQSSHLPLKLNMAGVIPPIFASSIILLPSTIVSWFSSGASMNWLKDISAAFVPRPAHLRDALRWLPLCSSASSTPRWCSTAVRPQTTSRKVAASSLAFVLATRLPVSSTRFCCV